MRKFNLVGTAFSAAMLAMVPAAFAENVKVGYVSPVASQAGQAMTSEIMEKFAVELGWDYRLMDGNLSPDRQVSHVDTLTTLGMDVIASWSLDPGALSAAYARANEAGIPVIGWNSTGPGVGVTVWWEFQTCTDGGPHDRQAQWIKERRPDAKVIVLGGPPVESIRNLVTCFSKYAEKHGLEIVEQTDNTKDSTANAAAMGSALMIRHPEASVYWAYNDSTALGIAAAAMSAGKSIYAADGSDGIMVFGGNADAEAIAALREGRITGTWDPDNYATAGALILAMKNLVENPDGEQKDLVAKSIFYTYENIDEYVAPLERGYTLDTVPLVD